MRFATVASLVLAGSAAAQSPLSILSSFGINLSSGCQNAVIGLLTTNSSFSQCISAASLLPVLSANTSIVPALDNLMSNTCYGQPCSNATLQNATQILQAGCQADIANGTISNTTIPYAIGLYPLIREALCLKTSQPYTAQSYGGALGAPAIPITAYNSTGGYFCVSSLLTQLSAYFGTNLTLPYLTGALTGQNTTAAGLIQSIQPNIICNGCIFGLVDLIAVQFPAVANVSLAAAVGGIIPAARQIPAATTLKQGMDATCAYVPLTVSTNGTLPANISVAIVNSTFAYNVTNGPTA